VEVIECDILENKHHICPAVLAALNRATGDPSGPWKLIANLPYSIATPLLINLMLLENPPLRMCFTVQKEVADRIDARPCTRDYGPVSIVLQRTCRISRIAELPPDVFWPAPEVSSTMLRLDLLHESLSPTLSAESAFIRSCFLHRRKTLRSNLLRACGQEMVDQLAKVMDLTRRPEALSVDEWFDLSHRVIVS
jgi:16S rRNA (adenine1518-N6/adenine1519-N6)-dimethyltransferase